MLNQSIDLVKVNYLRFLAVLLLAKNCTGEGKSFGPKGPLSAEFRFKCKAFALPYIFS